MSQPLSPRADAPKAAHHASWQPQEIAYSEHFDDALQRVLDYPPRSRDGIAILPDDSQDEAQPGVSIRLRDIDAQSLPNLDLRDLPLSLDDPRRAFASPVPGVRLTHPGGFLEGGPGLSPDEQRAFARDFIARLNISDPEQLAIAVQDHMAQALAQAKERMQARDEAQQHNARIEKEIKTLMDQREMEVKIETRMKDDARKRRETREHKKKKIPTV